MKLRYTQVDRRCGNKQYNHHDDARQTKRVGGVSHFFPMREEWVIEPENQRWCVPFEEEEEEKVGLDVEISVRKVEEV